MTLENLVIAAITAFGIGCFQENENPLGAKITSYVEEHINQPPPGSHRAAVPPSPGDENPSAKWHSYGDAATLIDNNLDVWGRESLGENWTFETAGSAIIWKWPVLHQSPGVMDALSHMKAGASMRGSWEPGCYTFGRLQNRSETYASTFSGTALYWLCMADANQLIMSGESDAGTTSILLSLSYARDWITSGDIEMESRGLDLLLSEASMPFISSASLGRLEKEQLNLIMRGLAEIERSLALPSNAYVRILEKTAPAMERLQSHDEFQGLNEEMDWVFGFHSRLTAGAKLIGRELFLAMNSLRLERLELSCDQAVSRAETGGWLELADKRIRCRSRVAALQIALGCHLGQELEGAKDPQGGTMRILRLGDRVRVLTSGTGISHAESVDVPSN